MQFQVPQFIDTEDKIVGPLSLRQFIYIGSAGALSALLYFTIGGFITIAFSIVLFLIGIGLAFVKIEGRPLANVIAAAANFYWKPQTYVWQPEHSAIGAAQKRPAAKSSLAASIEKIASGASLHKSWENLQTGGKISDRQFMEKKMDSRYQIFNRNTGERQAAKRIDYR